MNKIVYRLMTLADVHKLNEINAAQYIHRAWRDVDGIRQLVTINYQDPTWPQGYATHFNALARTIKHGGVAIGAFDDADRLVAFATVEKRHVNAEVECAYLDQLFVSLDMRRIGVGKELFFACIHIAQQWRAARMLICAGSAEETVAFYRALGCVDCIDQYRVFKDSDPRDLKLEYQTNFSEIT